MTTPPTTALPARRRVDVHLPVCRSRLILQCLLLTALLPGAAAAQAPERFVEALIRFATALGGTYGDEDTQVQSALESMSQSLAEWDADISALESRAVRAGPSDPSRAQVHVQLGRAYLRRGRTADARRELGRASRLDPDRPDVHVLLGVIHDAGGRHAEAAAAFNAAWERDPGNPVNAYLFVQRAPAIARASGVLDVLAAAYRTAASEPRRSRTPPFDAFTLIPQPGAGSPLMLPALYADGYALLVKGDFHGALARFRAAANADSLHEDGALHSARMADGITALRQGRLAAARDSFQAVLAMAPESSEAHRLLGVAFWANYEFDKSIRALETAIRLSPLDERSRLMLVRVLTQAEAFARAEAVLHETLDVLPQSSLARLWLGSVYVGLGRNADAAQAFDAASRFVLSGQGQLFTTIGWLYQDVGNFAGAIDAFARAVRANPTAPATHVDLAAAYLAGERPDEAFAEYVAALLIDPEHGPSYMGIGQFHLNAGRYADAIEALQRLVALQPNDGDARYALANALLRSGRTDEGTRRLAEFQRYQAQRTDRARHSMALDALKEEAALRTAEGAFTRAAALWQQAVDQQPDVAANHAALAAARVAGGQLDEAVRHYERAAALGGRPYVYGQLAALYARLGRHEDSATALARYERALLAPATAGARR